jgi:thiol-disulfide isomerase/thioredoxin
LKNRSFFIIFLMAISGCVSSPHLSGLIGQEAPLVRFTAIDGTYRSTNEFKGKTVVVAFWAEWCMFSKPVIEELNELASRNRYDETIFLAVSIDPATSFPRLQKRIQEQRLYHMEHAFSGNALLDEAYHTLKAQELPHVYVIDPEGRIIAEGHDADVALNGIEEAQRKG